MTPVTQTSLRASLSDLFIDPISQEIMTDPVIANCGHTFERVQISGWLAARIQQNAPTTCPLCRVPVTQMINNILLRNALDTLNSYPAATDMTGFTDEEQNNISRATSSIENRRNQDRLHQIPDRLPERQLFARIGDASTKSSNATSQFYRRSC